MPAVASPAPGDGWCAPAGPNLALPRCCGVLLDLFFRFVPLPAGLSPVDQRKDENGGQYSLLVLCQQWPTQRLMSAGAHQHGRTWLTHAAVGYSSTRSFDSCIPLPGCHPLVDRRTRTVGHFRYPGGCCGTHMAECSTLILGASVIRTLDLLFQPLTIVQ